MTSNPKIQHAAVVSQRPKCLGCSKPLKPNYDTQTQGERKLVTRKEQPPANEYDWTFDQDLKVWTKVRWVKRVKSRTWDGTYGDIGEGFFCGTRCGYRYGRYIALGVRSAKERSS